MGSKRNYSKQPYSLSYLSKSSLTHTIIHTHRTSIHTHTHREPKCLFSEVNIGETTECCRKGKIARVEIVPLQRKEKKLID